MTVGNRTFDHLKDKNLTFQISSLLPQLTWGLCRAWSKVGILCEAISLTPTTPSIVLPLDGVVGVETRRYSLEVNGNIQVKGCLFSCFVWNPEIFSYKLLKCFLTFT